MSAEVRLGYRPGLDGLRAVAIGLVVLHHTADFLVPRWSDSFFTGGFLGVDLFFVLSGFLITTLLLERRERSEANALRWFYARRALRLLPAVVVLLLGVSAISLAESEGLGIPLRSFAVVLTYTTNWAEIRSVSFSPYLAHLWSLAIEEQFYLTWPVLLLGALSAGASRRAVATGAGILAIMSAAWRYDMWIRGVGWLAIYIRTDARADALLIGALLALLRIDVVVARLSPSGRTVLGGAGLGFLVAAAIGFRGDSDFLYVGGFTLVAIAAAAVISAEVAGSWAGHAVLSTPPMVWLGRLSYSLYLWHFVVFGLVANHLGNWPSAGKVAFGWSAALTVSYLSYAFVERPVLRLKDRVGRPPRARASLESVRP